MIKVTIELLSAITHRTTEIGRMYITNDGAGNADRGNYDVAVCRRGEQDVPSCAVGFNSNNGAPAARTGKVTDYPRLAYNVWRLIARSVLAAFPEEIKTKPGKGYSTTITPEVMQGMALVTQQWMDDRKRDGTKEEPWNEHQRRRLRRLSIDARLR